MLLASLYTVGRGCHRDEHGSGRKGEEGFQGAHVLPEAGLCSLFSTLLPLQWLGQAWCVLKLTQLSGGLFFSTVSFVPHCRAEGFAKLLPWMLLIWRGQSIPLALPVLPPLLSA